MPTPPGSWFVLKLIFMVGITCCKGQCNIQTATSNLLGFSGDLTQFATEVDVVASGKTTDESR